MNDECVKQNSVFVKVRAISSEKGIKKLQSCFHKRRNNNLGLYDFYIYNIDNQ